MAASACQAANQFFIQRQARRVSSRRTGSKEKDLLMPRQGGTITGAEANDVEEGLDTHGRGILLLWTKRLEAP